MERVPAETLRCSRVPAVATDSLSFAGEAGILIGISIPATGVLITDSMISPSPLELDGGACDAEFVPELLYERFIPDISDREGSPPSEAIGSFSAQRYTYPYG